MTIRYGIIGTGWITEAFLAGAAGVPGMALRAVCSRSEERGREFAARHGADLVFTDPARMAASPDIDAVYIASPNVLHAAQSRLFLENGKHVLCEKPLAARPEEVESLQALAANRGLVYMEAIMLLHMPQLAVLEEAVGGFPWPISIFPSYPANTRPIWRERPCPIFSIPPWRPGR